MFTPFQLRHPLEVKTNRLLDFHTLELHHIGARAGVDLSDNTFPEDRMLDLIIDLEPVRRGFPQDGGVDVLDLAQTLFIEALLDDADTVVKVLLDFEDEAGRDPRLPEEPLQAENGRPGSAARMI